MSETPAPLKRDAAALAAGLPHIDASPADGGVLRLIVRRPAVDAREVVTEGRLDETVGLVGDNWLTRGEARRPPKPADPEAQLTLMNARAAALVAGEPDRWPLAGDQLYVDLDLGLANLPPGSRLAVGEAIVEISAKPHTGCKKFVERFGMDAMLFVNAPEGRARNLRGVNAKVVRGGRVAVGDTVRKL